MKAAWTRAVGQPRSRHLRFAPLLVIGAAAAISFATGWYEQLSLATFLAERKALLAFVAAHHLGAIALFALVYAVAVALSMPGAMLCTLAAGFLFGGLVGGIVAALAATTGAVAIFLAARTSLGEWLRAGFGPALAGFARKFEADAASYLLFLRLTPIFPFWLVNLGTALLNVPLRVFVWTTFVGILPASFAFAFAGSGLDSVIDARRQIFEACIAAGKAKCKFGLSVTSLITPQMLLAFAALGIAALIPVVLKGLRHRAAPEIS